MGNGCTKWKNVGKSYLEKAEKNLTLFELGSKQLKAPELKKFKKDVEDNIIRAMLPTIVESVEVFHRCACCLVVE